jgi:azurin
MVSACGGSSGKETGSSTAASEKSGRSAQSGTSASEGPVAKTVTLHPKGNQMKYKETKLTVPAGKNVKLVFENTATSPSMQHNVVVLTKSPKQKFFKKVGQAGVSAGSTSDYVPSDMASVLTHTPIAKPGETVSVTFQAPSEPGKYGYVCTYPGHWATMQGAMVVKG